MPDLLIELFSEEIPARMQTRAAEDLKKAMTGRMVEAGLTYASAGAFATPRRLALSVTGLPAMTPDRREERKGPRTDAPEKALEGFLRSTGLSREDLERRQDKKGEVFYAVIETPGRPAAEVIAEALVETIRSFPWPKSMRWGTGSLRWVRPLQSILCILTDEEGARVVPMEIEGIASGRTTRGHRFMAPEPFEVRDFDSYAAGLEAAHVVLDVEERKRRIAADMGNAAFAQGLEPVEDAGLLDEVAGLVEWPVVLMGEIGEDFLGLPPEVLRTSMKEHQKFFSVRNPATGRIERFVTVANIEAPDGGEAILAGNRRVLAARLSDARFFWENDLRVVEGKGAEGLAAMAAPLATTVFHRTLGTQAERVARIARIAGEIAPALGADPAEARLAAETAKTDLASEMVYEFPELQGVMGGYYIRAAGLPDAVAAAAPEHYRPLGPSDPVPTAPVSVAVALADKIDMLTGFWAIGETPTGSKDPFALRRAALGLIRTVLENGLRIGLLPVFETAVERLKADAAPIREAGEATQDRQSSVGHLLEFLEDRITVALRAEGIRIDAIRACRRFSGNADLTLLVARVRALQDFLGTEDGGNLLAGYRRASNILTAEEKKDGALPTGTPDPALATEPAETSLMAALDRAVLAITPALDAEDFAQAMSVMAGLRAPVDAFFEEVLVNAEDAALRANRLKLLAHIREVMRQIADWDRIEG